MTEEVRCPAVGGARTDPHGTCTLFLGHRHGNELSVGHQDLTDPDGTRRDVAPFLGSGRHGSLTRAVEAANARSPARLAARSLECQRRGKLVHAAQSHASTLGFHTTRKQTLICKLIFKLAQEPSQPSILRRLEARYGAALTREDEKHICRHHRGCPQFGATYLAQRDVDRDWQGLSPGAAVGIMM
jgi:hypothetical protein